MYRNFGEIGYVEEIGVDAATGEPVKVFRKSDIRVPDEYGEGKARIGYMPCTANLALAAAGVGNLVFTPNRNIEIVGMVLDTYVAAAAAATHAPGAIHITAITVQGRNLVPGAGFIPARSFYFDAAMRHQPFLLWGACEASQNVVVSFINNDAATAHNITGALKCIFAD